MTDFEKVVKGLEELRDHLFHEYKVCYHGDEEDVYRRFLVVDDALALLKEDEEKLRRFTITKRQSINDDWSGAQGNDLERIKAQAERSEWGIYE